MSDLARTRRCKRCNHYLEVHGPGGCEYRTHVTEHYGDTGCGCYDDPAEENLVDVTPPGPATTGDRDAVADWLAEMYNGEDTWVPSEDSYHWQIWANELLALLQGRRDRDQS